MRACLRVRFISSVCLRVFVFVWVSACVCDVCVRICLVDCLSACVYVCCSFACLVVRGFV